MLLWFDLSLNSCSWRTAELLLPPKGLFAGCLPFITVYRSLGKVSFPRRRPSGARAAFCEHVCGAEGCVFSQGPFARRGFRYFECVDNIPAEFLCLRDLSRFGQEGDGRRERVLECFATSWRAEGSESLRCLPEYVTRTPNTSGFFVVVAVTPNLVLCRCERRSCQWQYLFTIGSWHRTPQASVYSL